MNCSVKNVDEDFTILIYTFHFLTSGAQQKIDEEFSASFGKDISQCHFSIDYLYLAFSALRAKKENCYVNQSYTDRN